MKVDTFQVEAGRGKGFGVDLPLDREVIFSNHKRVTTNRIEKRKKKLLNKISFIKTFLDDDETIQYITSGCSPTSIWEQLITGWIFIYLKRSLFVFTNKRIFHIPTKGDFSYRNSIAHIPYSGCTSIGVKGSKLRVEYRGGEAETFLCIPRSDRKKIKSLLPSLSFQGMPGARPGRVHLCPRCKVELDKGRYRCQSCHLEFKDMEKGKRVSLIYPGGGYFFTGHPFLGISDAIVEIILIVLVAMSAVGVMRGVRGSGVLLGIYVVALVIEKAISVYHSNHFIREYIPIEKEIRGEG